mmetsp:Transcript_41886/g.80129  ORF Transcript_41886/g.80129 Transcript_41886/m.80129 type:complete len:229 (-) Transcript_41886:54-740(-)
MTEDLLRADGVVARFRLDSARTHVPGSSGQGRNGVDPTLRATELTQYRTCFMTSVIEMLAPTTTTGLLGVARVSLTEALNIRIASGRPAEVDEVEGVSPTTFIARSIQGQVQAGDDQDRGEEVRAQPEVGATCGHDGSSWELCKRSQLMSAQKSLDTHQLETLLDHFVHSCHSILCECKFVSRECVRNHASEHVGVLIMDLIPRGDMFWASASCSRVCVDIITLTWCA